MKHTPMRRQDGVSLLGLIFVLFIVGMLAVLAMKVVPTYTEYRSVLKAIEFAKANGSSVQEVQSAFNKQRDISYIDAIGSGDLEITKENGVIEVSFAYKKVIPLFGPASLQMDYSGTTAKAPRKEAKEKTPQ